MNIFILSGGMGTGLWPLSRENYPKQFLNLLGEKSLLELTIERFLPIFSSSSIFIITQKEQEFLVLREVEKYGIKRDQLILEPSPRGTAPAILLGIRYLKDIKNIKDDEILVVPSDHYIRETDLFLDHVGRLGEIPRGYLVTFGVRAEESNPGYGYIVAGERGEGNCYLVDKFIEKPSSEVILSLLEKNPFWNTGILFFRIDDFLREMNFTSPNLVEKGPTFAELLEHFSEFPPVSIDRALLERTQKLLVYPLEVTWLDIGTFDALYELLGERKERSLREEGSSGNLVFKNDEKLVVLVGVHDTTVVDTEDVLLLVKRSETHKIKEIVRNLPVEEIEKMKHGMTTYRPWGYYKILEEWERFKIKRLVVYPGEALSIQMHHHRTEHWVVVKGTAKVVIEEKEQYLHEGESVFIPKSTKHSLENPGKVELEVIEVQNGEYLEEDDIVRFDPA
ncbi:MAG: mannose-1-phosphate guanylyltransferase/mannose-6-phosphate isomerase [Candidatus Atribacteria bacterium]|nr:mannose-1-phosphate guanylyltransferase/mannose-6-phosphate isomerase [Candidatus Atribacteria bacterium]